MVQEAHEIVTLLSEEYPRSLDNALDAFQRDACSRMANDLTDLFALATLALGLGGEAGEVQDIIKKIIGHGHPMDKNKLMLEISDVLWYVAVLSDRLGFKLSEVADANTAKLKARYGEKFSVQKSMNRV